MGPISKLVLLCAAMAFLAGCMPDSPRTALDWGVNDTLHRPAHSTACHMLQEAQFATRLAQRKQLSDNSIQLIDRTQHQ